MIAQVLALLLIGLSACAASAPAGQLTGTVSGRVLVLDCGGPVLRQGQPWTPCTTHPMPSVTVTFTAGSGGAVASVLTNACGAYSIALAPGTYTVSTVIFGGYETATVVVTAGQTATMDFRGDSRVLP